MRIRRIERILSAGIVCVAVACQDGVTAPRQATPTPLLPLRLGTSFSYHSTDTLIGAAFAGLSNAPDSDFTVAVVSDVIDVRGTHWATLDADDRMFGPAASGSWTYFTSAADGLRSLYNNFPTGLDALRLSALLLPYPGAPGAVGQFGATVIATDTVITVPAGTFHCVRYDYPFARSLSLWSLFIAPGTGVVQRILTVSSFNGPNFELLGKHDRIYRLTAIAAP
jgi:hypothetical protein